MASPQLSVDAVGPVGVKKDGKLLSRVTHYDCLLTPVKSQLSPTGRSSHSHHRLACQPVRSDRSSIDAPAREEWRNVRQSPPRAVQPRQHASPAPKCPVRTISEAPAEPPVGLSAVRICALSSPSSYAMNGKTAQRQGPPVSAGCHPRQTCAVAAPQELAWPRAGRTRGHP